MKKKRGRYYEVLDHHEEKGEYRQLVEFHLTSKISRAQRRAIFDTILEETGAKALIEIMRNKKGKGGIMRKDSSSFYAILIFDERPASR